MMDLIASDAELTQEDRIVAVRILRATDTDKKCKVGRPRTLEGLAHSATMIADRMMQDWKRENNEESVPGSKRDEYIEAALCKIHDWFPDEEQPNYDHVLKLLANPGRWRKKSSGEPMSRAEIRNLFASLGGELDADV
tara:strand:- start:1457 stop:1870 length:414 start_codon:yes stop_codon:yes gene_type:complete